MRSLEVELTDRTLRFDGVSTLAPDLVADALLRGVQPSALRVRSMTPDIELFNAQVPEAEAIQVGSGGPVKLDLRWRLPESYRTLDLWDRLMDAYADRATELNYTVQQEEEIGVRLEEEYAEIKKRGMVEFFQTVIYILDTFKKEGVVWGVGRGSSCASYALFILGLHAVDCVRYNVPMDEFFHD
jgi:hypothetical protein